MPIDINTDAGIDLFEITQRINERLGLSASLPGGEVNAPEGTFWDCQFGSLPFLYAFSDENPLIRETAQFRRERIDTATNPGEQSPVFDECFNCSRNSGEPAQVRDESGTSRDQFSSNVLIAALITASQGEPGTSRARAWSNVLITALIAARQRKPGPSPARAGTDAK